MMSHYHHNVPGPPPAPAGVRYGTATIISENQDTITHSTQIIGGPVSGTVTLRINIIGGSPGSYFNLNGVDMFTQNQTITLNLDPSGEVSFATITHAGPGSGGGPGGFWNCVLTIDSVSSGIVGSPSTKTYQKTST